MRRVAEAVLLVALAALPLHRPLLHEAPNVGLCDVLAAGALALYLLIWRLPRRAWLRPALVALALLPSLAVSPAPASGAAELAGVVYVQLLAACAASLAARRRDDGLVAIVAGAAVAAAVGFAVWQTYPWMRLPRPVGATESPAMLSMVALAGLFALRLLAARQPARLGRWRWPLEALFWIVLVAAQSRVLLAAVVGVALVAWPRRRLVAAGAASLALAAFVVSLWFRVVPLGGPAGIDLHPSPYRVCHAVAWRAFAHRPLAGVGLRGFWAAWPRYVDERVATAAFAPLAPGPRDPHGTLSGWAAEAGLPGLALVVLLAADVWRRRLPAREAAAYFAAVVVASFTLDVLTERTTWALLGLMSGGYHWPSDASTPRASGDQATNSATVGAASTPSSQA